MDPKMPAKMYAQYKQMLQQPLQPEKILMPKHTYQEVSMVTASPDPRYYGFDGHYSHIPENHPFYDMLKELQAYFTNNVLVMPNQVKVSAQFTQKRYNRKTRKKNKTSKIHRARGHIDFTTKQKSLNAAIYPEVVRVCAEYKCIVEVRMLGRSIGKKKGLNKYRITIRKRR